MTALRALGSGFIGACTVTLLHETARRLIPEAPRMDILGMRAIAKLLRKARTKPPSDDRLHSLALLGDIVSNTMYYSLVGLGKGQRHWLRGALLGAAAGVGGVFLPGPLGLGRKPSARTPRTQVLTVVWYLAGGLAAAAARRLMPEVRP